MSQSYSLAEISNAIHADLMPGVDQDFIVSEINTDSRRIAFPEKSIFFALKTDRGDGHRFIEKAHKAGVQCFVVERSYIPPDPLKKANFLTVNSTLEALHRLGKWKRDQFSYPVVAITGSNGKTMVKEWLYQMLNSIFRIVRSPKSYNSQIGVPLSLCQISSDFNLGIFEAGISEKGEMKRLAEMIQPTIGVFTNLLDAHDENFESRKEKCIEKLKLFQNVKQLVFCADDPLIQQCVNKSGLSTQQLFSWSRTPGHQVCIAEKSVGQRSTEITLSFEGNSTQFIVPYTDPANLQNCIHCACTSLALGVSIETLPSLTQNLRPVNMRLNLEAGINNCELINDFYNSDFEGLKIALEFLQSQQQKQSTTVILSDILEHGSDTHSLYERVAQLLKSKNINRLFAVGSDFEKYQSLFDLDCSFFPSTAALLQEVSPSDFHNETILLKGARVFAFEKIAQLLKKKAHQTVLEVNLSAIQHNFNYFRSLLRPTTKTMVMVKALSYGAGTHEIAKLLAFNNTAYLGVAFLDEGIALREAGITSPVMVLNPDFEALELLEKYDLEPEIYNMASLNLLLQFTQNRQSPLTPLKVHLKIDTGMHRLGFMVEEINEVLALLVPQKSIKIMSVFSHLATSDDPSMEEHTQNQIHQFSKARKLILAQLPTNPPLFHLLNSAGVENYPEAQFDMVRIGIGLYGVASNPVTQQ